MTRSESNSEVSEGTQSSYGIPIDLLKNTPSNIARLEDVIDQCKGRQKYLAQTRSPSDGEDVRWYFCKVPLAENALAASVPRTEVVGKGEYFRFAMRDSLALEASFLQREEELLSVWWKEYGECSEGPSGSNNNNKTLDLQQEPCSSEGDQTTQLSVDEEERVGVPVKGGLYEVDLAKRHCFPVYWNGENRRVLRGHWFARKASLDWLPLREDVAEQLEFAYRRQVWHRRTFQPSGLFAARVDMQGSMLGLHALFTGEDDTWEAWLNIDASGLSNVFNIRGNGIKLRRGYSPSGSAKPTQDELRQQKEEEMDDYCSQVPVGHLVFMVHGIGQRLEKANLVDDVGNFRQITASLAERHLSSYQRDTQRVLFIPCQWRRGLKLGGESTVEKITLNGVRGLRVMLSATAHDILYYMSPIYCQEIINSVSNQLNRLYKKFLKRNPGYDGKVSIYAHSLGSVLSYDILCHQYDLSSPFPMDCVYKEHVKEELNQLDQCSESKSSSTKDEYPEPFPPKETTNDQDAIPQKSPASKLQEASSIIYPEDVPDICQQSLESKQFTDTRDKDSSDMLSLEKNQLELPSNKNNGFCSSESDSQQENTTDSANHTLESKESADLLFEEDIQEQASTNMLSLEENDMELSAENNRVFSCELDSQQDNTIDSAKHTLEFKQSANLLLEEDIQEQASSSMLSLEENDMELGAEKNGVSSCEIDRVQKNSSDNTTDENKLIKLLMEEVDSLKARIADLESRTDDEDTTRENHQDDKEVGEDTPKEGISQKTLEQVNLDKTYTPHIKYTKLDFKVDTFFAVGSPLGVFLALRNVRMGIGRGKDYWQDETIIEEMPACRQMFNIFHPFDPVAYRVDPLVCKEYTDKRPVIIPWHRGGKRIHIGFQEFKEDLSLRSRAVVQRINTVTVKVVTACQSRNNDNPDDGTEGSSETEERSYGSIMMERLTGDKEGHIDHVLQDKTFEHQYISAIGSHTNYWRDNDTALFILKHLYRDIPEEPHSPLQDEDTSSLINKPKFFQSDTVDDQLPLTFSDRMIAREFSRKIRKAMKKNM